MAKEKRVKERLDDPVGLGEPHLHSPLMKVSASAERRLAAVAPGLVVAWLGGVYLACYAFLPLALRTLGLDAPSAGWQALLQLPGFASAGVVATVLAGLFGRVEASPPAQRIAWAAGVSLLAWAVLHNTLPGFEPFLAMGWSQLLSFTATNLVEHLLLGLAAAGLAGSTSRAVLAALVFQLVQFGISGLIFGVSL